jgi:very-short-patch-repair endonuclease
VAFEGKVWVDFLPKNDYYCSMKKLYWKLETGMHYDASPKIFEFALKNRHEPTETEALLWEALKGNAIAKNKFRRQHPIGKYIVDFYCHAKRLAVEIDGGYHLTAEQKLYDEYRTAELNQLGIREIRFTNDDVLNDFWGVLEAIWNVLETMDSAPTRRASPAPTCPPPP